MVLQVVTCGNVPLESAFQKVSRCVYTSTSLYEYRGWDSKAANPEHRRFTWGLRSLEVRRDLTHISIHLEIPLYGWSVGTTQCCHAAAFSLPLQFMMTESYDFYTYISQISTHFCLYFHGLHFVQSKSEGACNFPYEVKWERRMFPRTERSFSWYYSLVAQKHV